MAKKSKGNLSGEAQKLSDQIAGKEKGSNTPPSSGKKSKNAAAEKPQVQKSSSGGSVQQFKDRLDDVVSSLRSKGLISTPDQSGGTAPPGSGMATRPIAAPRSTAGGLAQNTINQINRAAYARQTDMLSEEWHDSFNTAATARAPLSMEGIQGGGKIQHGFGGYSQESAVKQKADGPRPLSPFDQARRAIFGASAPSSWNRGKPPIDSEPSVNYDRERDSIISNRNRMAKSYAKAITKEARAEVASEDAARRSMRQSMHPDTRADYDRAMGVETSDEDRENDLSEAGGMAPKRQSRLSGFKAFRAFHALKSVSRLGNEMIPEGTTSAQSAPFVKMISEAAPLLGGPLGAAAYGAAAAGHFVNQLAETRVEKSDALYDLSQKGRRLRDQKLFANIEQEAIANRTGSNATYYQRIMAPFGNVTPEVSAAKDANEKIQAIEREGDEANLNIGQRAANEIAAYASKKNIRADQVPQNIRDQIINKEVVAHRKEIQDSPQFQKALQKQLNLIGFTYGAGSEGIYNEQVNKYLNMIQLNPDEARKLGFETPSLKREDADLAIQRYQEKNPTKLAEIDYIGRTWELYAKAQRHRHLAEY